MFCEGNEWPKQRGEDEKVRNAPTPYIKVGGVKLTKIQLNFLNLIFINNNDK